MAQTPANKSRFRRTGTILALSIMLGVAALLVGRNWWGKRETHSHEPADPRLTYRTPYKNVHPRVRYVGDQVCADCHSEIHKAYRKHPMGRAMAPIAAATSIERVDATAFNPFTSSALHYGVRHHEGRVYHRQWCAHADTAATEREVDFACGSGARARSYIIEDDGFLFQSPITWYPQGSRWDLSPSYEKRNQHFSRPVSPGCLFCHCNHAEHIPHTINRYKPPIFNGHAIGCERCHGPGELHVERRSSDEKVVGLDETIVNPSRLEHSLREAVCQQCHLQSEQRVVARGRTDFDYRPGLPLHLFLMDFVNAREPGLEAKFVGSVEQMMASRCYNSSREPKKMGCVTCHDPHRHPTAEERVAHYRKSCLKCHAEQSCSLTSAVRREKSKQDSCIDCHMPRTGSEVNHTAITDHRIPRRAGNSIKKPGDAPIPGPDDLVPFQREQIDLRDPEYLRNFGIALMQMQDRGLPDSVAHQFGEKALPLLSQAIERDGHDIPALQAKSGALWSLNRREEALAVCETTLSQVAESEVTLHAAGNLALELNQPDAARGYFERAVQVNPWRWQYFQGLAVASFRRGEWNRAVDECQKSLRIAPANPSSRSLLIQCHLAAGQKDKAQAEFETLRHLTPESRREGLGTWYEEQRRRLGPLK